MLDCKVEKDVTSNKMNLAEETNEPAAVEMKETTEENCFNGNDNEKITNIPGLVVDLGNNSSNSPMATEDQTAAVASEENAGATASGASTSTADQPDSSNGVSGFVQSVYHIKWVSFKGPKVPIVTQNENGPCPLLAVMNVLLLQGRVKFPAMMEMVTSGQLMEYLADCVLESAPEVC